MKTVHIKDFSGQYDTKSANTKWILDKGFTITSASDFGFWSTHEGTQVVVKGTIDHTSTSGSGIGLLGAGSGAIIAKSGAIHSACGGLYLDNDNQYLVNHGLIDSQTGIMLNGEDSTVTNTGEIRAAVDVALSLSNVGQTVDNAKGALIKGTTAIDTTYLAADDIRIANHGRIIGDDWAFSGGGGDDHIINRGRIVGSVLLGDGTNIFDTRGGTVAGDVAGGSGQDTYIIDDADIGIFDAAGNGYDTLKTSVAYVLESNNEIEVLTAIGKKNINLTANDFANRLNGNKGDNALDGMGGVDWLNGGKGDDTLHGGAGDDYFIFKKGGGHDFVMDFTPGEDTLYVENFYLNKGYDDLHDHMKVYKGDLIITIGEDRIRLDGITALDETDVTFANL